MPKIVSDPASSREGDTESQPLHRSVPSWLSKGMIFDVLALYDVLAITSTAWVSYYLYVVLYARAQAEITSYALVVCLEVLLFHTVARKSGEYDVPPAHSPTSSLSNVLSICALTVGSSFIFLFFMKVQPEFSRIWFLLWFVLLLVSLSAGRAVSAYYLALCGRTGLLRRSIALIGSGGQFQAAKAALQQDANHYSVVSAVELSAGGAGASSESNELSANLEFFLKEARKKHADEVIVALPSGMGRQLQEIVRKAQTLPVDIRVVPDFGGTKIHMFHMPQIADLPLITAVSKPISEWGGFLKMVEDYAFAVIALILFAPAMALIAIAIKLDSKGPVLFRQRRHGYNYRVVEVLKFRTMTVMEDGAQITQATKNDKRITRVGAFLRRTSLDELPQFWNVIRGEMSIVGPRPHAIAHNNYYDDLIENYANRHRVKPGITGWAQVHGFRGETSTPDMMANRVRYDLEYIENWSLWLDLKIVIMTPLFGLFRRSAY